MASKERTKRVGSFYLQNEVYDAIAELSEDQGVSQSILVNYILGKVINALSDDAQSRTYQIDGLIDIKYTVIHNMHLEFSWL